MSTKLTALRWLLGMMLLITSTANAALDQQYRDNYSHLNTITMNQVSQNTDNVVFVDVRTRYEYNLLHIMSAVNVHYYAPDFEKRLQAIRERFPTHKIILYCDNQYCEQSFKAAHKATEAGVSGVYVYQNGLYEWVSNFPSLTLYRGEEIEAIPASLSNRRFNRHQVSPDDFLSLAAQRAGAVVDIRYGLDNEPLTAYANREHRVSLHDLEATRTLLKELKAEEKTVLVYDKTGARVRWMMELLDEMDINDYYFLGGGSKIYFDLLKKQYFSQN